MKTLIPWFAAVSAIAVNVSSAFTLDAVGYQGGELPLNPLSIFVPGYGEVVFEDCLGSMLVVESAYQNSSSFDPQTLRHDPADDVKIIFSDQERLNLSLASIGLPSGASFGKGGSPLAEAAESSAGVPSDAEDGSAGFIPEATSAVLGLIGTLLLLARRNR